jgi:PAS domain S-box-containing protein
MLRQMPGFVALLSGPEHRYEYVNDAYVEISGARQFIGRTVAEVFPELNDQGFYELLAQVFTTGRPFVAHAMPIRLARADGERFIDFLYHPIQDAAGAVVGIFVGGYDVTERVRAEAGLRAERDRLASVLEGMGEGFALFSHDFRILDVNAEALRLEKRPREALVGRSHWEVYPETENSELGLLYKKAMRDRVPVALEHRFMRENGCPAWLDMRAYPVADGLAVFYRDVTGRRMIEAERDQAATLLRTFMEAVPGVIYAKDRQGRMLIANDGVAALVGKSPADFLGRTDAEFLDDAVQGEAIMATDRRIMQTGLAEQIEETVTQPSGAPAVWLSTKAPLRDAAGEVIGLVGASIDITARKQAEAALTEAEERLRLATQAADIGFWDVDTVRGILTWSPPVRAMFGVAEHAPVSMDVFYGGLHPDDRDATIAAYRAACDPARRLLYDVEYRTIGQEDGVIRWVAAKGRALFDQAGRCYRVIGTAIDITTRKAAEEELRRLNATLERRVADAIAEREVAMSRLHEMQKLETIGQLSGGIAHDFNNLLTPIFGALDWLQRQDSLGARGMRMVGGALQSAERARILVGRLLSFARRQHLDSCAVDVPLLVDGMADLIDRSLGPLIEVSRQADPGLPPAQVDPNQLELALLNLAVNARDAMPGGGRLSIAVDLAEIAGPGPAGLASGDYVRLRVSDTGMGMDAETLRRAVEPFYTTKSVGKGTGLGLSMVHGLAAQSGGALVLESTPGQGTVATIYLPAAPGQAVAPRADVAALPAAGRELTVLLVDDEDLVRMGLRDSLAALGHTVVEAASGEAALRTLSTEPAIGLVVTDFMMPNMTGVELVRAARRLRPGLPALLVTGFAECGLADIADLPRLNKPFRHADLAATIAMALSRPDVPVGRAVLS